MPNRDDKACNQARISRGWETLPIGKNTGTWLCWAGPHTAVGLILFELRLENSKSQINNGGRSTAFHGLLHLQHNLLVYAVYGPAVTSTESYTMSVHPLQTTMAVPSSVAEQRPWPWVAYMVVLRCKRCSKTPTLHILPSISNYIDFGQLSWNIPQWQSWNLTLRMFQTCSRWQVQSFRVSILVIRGWGAILTEYEYNDALINHEDRRHRWSLRLYSTAMLMKQSKLNWPGT